nr:cysteine proteinase inhibitor 1-like [Ipomoea batatas]
MALNSRSVSLTLFSLTVATVLFSNAVAAPSGGPEGPIVGGWSSIKDPNAPQVVEIAKFAIDAHNKEAKTNLKFESVIKGENQVVAGVNYKLVIAAEDGGAGNKYEAVVYDRPWDKFRELTSFKQV